MAAGYTAIGTYTEAMHLADQEAEFTVGRDGVLASEPFWANSDLADEICIAKNITRRHFARMMCAPKPGRIENLLICGELRKIFGDVSQYQGFDGKGIYQLPSSSGLLVPVLAEGKVTALRFVRLSEALKTRF